MRRPSWRSACAVTAASSAARSPWLALMTKASSRVGRRGCAGAVLGAMASRSNTNWAGAPGPARSASMGARSSGGAPRLAALFGTVPAPVSASACAYTVVIASCRNALTVSAQRRKSVANGAGAVSAQSLSNCAAWGAEVASTTRSKPSAHAGASPSPSASCHCAPSWRRAATRAPSRTCAPRAVSQRPALSGKSVPRSTRGSSRLEPPRAPNIASRSTRRNTRALACAMGVFSADTHSGSMKPSRSVGVSPAQSAPTLSWPSHSKPARCQAAAARSRLSLSRQPQPRAPRMPAAASHGAGQSGRARPLPSGKVSASGRRSKA